MTQNPHISIDKLISKRPTLPGWALTLLAAVFIMALHNATFWQRNFQLFEGNWPLVLVFGAAVWALTVLIATLIGFRWLQKPALILLLILGSITSFYQDTLGATIDREMVQNALTTTVTESKHLITASFITHVLLTGVLPALLVAWTRIKPVRLWRDIWGWALMSALSAALCFGLVLSNLKSFSVVLRGHKELMASYQPGAPLSATIRYARMLQKSAALPLQTYGVDAATDEELASATKPVLIVIVAGETARAQNFSLNGYARETNPELAKRDIFNFTNVSSCGTATAVSLPCMFSHFGRADYSFDKGISSENLLDVMGHAGYKVEWWDNNTGDKEIATRFRTRSTISTPDPEFCADGECTDGVFLHDLKELAANLTENTVLVLHMIGSHGPSYYLRYPPEFERFTPTCKTSELKNCSSEEILNAYDNTILYTDHILASFIDILDAEQNILPAMFYVSDHGESLGENGLYLHGAPYFMAPVEQTHVPMMLWMPETFSKTFEIDSSCMHDLADAPLSHDYLFSTILSLADVHSEVVNPSLNLIRKCHDEIN